ncbi:MAG: type II secretion system F family protein [Candidatus Eremiobacterota bacterium]
MKRFLERLSYGSLTTHLALSYRMLSAMYNAGIHIRRALEVLALQCDHPLLKRAMLDCAHKVDEGRRLSDTMSRHGDVFPLLHSNMIGLGEHTGSLHLILDRLAVQTEKANELRQRVRSALNYPIFIFIVAVILLLGAPAFVFKDLLRLLTELGVDLPWTTRLMIAASRVVASPWVLVLLAGAAFLLGVFVVRLRTDLNLRKRWEALLLAVPVLGPSLRATVVCDFTRALSNCYATGIPILKGLDLSARSTDNLVFIEAALRAQARMKEGAALHEALEATEFFPEITLQMVAVGEESGRMSAMLERAAKLSEDEVEHTLAIATAALQPLMLLVIGIAVGFVVIATMSPMLKVIEAF